ncbi:MAG: putative gluconeosis factor [Dehalococcoidia bacterium]|nr:putative gluconeosis factor [Dehalococcoidia bacterium]
MRELPEEPLGKATGMLMPRIRALLRPGLGLKRWLALLILGMALFSLGVAFTTEVSISPRILPALRALTLGELPPLARGGVFILIGTALGGVAAYQTYRWVVLGTSQRHGRDDILTAMDIKRRRDHGPRIVAIGGGTGLSTLLRGLKYQTGNLTAIVTIADDGGSSGRLRADLHMPPPGDARNCLVALSESEPLMEELFDHRFQGSSSLNGHSLGNLLLAALYEMRGGFQESLEAAAQLLALSGRVVPVSNASGLVLMGETVSGQVLRGESAIGHAPDGLSRVWIESEGAVASEAALEAIREAEMIVIGPGSLYTSIIPNFLLPGVCEAVTASPAPKVFVCNVATQPHETDGYSVLEHLRAFQAHSGVSVTHVLVNSNVLTLPEEWGQVAVPPIFRIQGFEGAVVLADVVDEGFPTRHDPRKLASALLSIGRSSSNGMRKTLSSKAAAPQPVAMMGKAKE